MPESAFASINNTLQPNTIVAETVSGNGFVPFSIASGHVGITNLEKIKLQHEHDRQLHSAGGDANCFSTMTMRINYESEKSVHHQEMVVESPSLNSPERMRRRWLVLGEFAKYAFCGLKRKRRNFERSVLKYVSIKIPALTHSGRKSRVCVNQPDRLTHLAKTHPLPLSFLSLLFCFTCLFAFRRPAIKSWSLCCLP